jgi:Domain of unknown function (DUF4917)
MGAFGLDDWATVAGQRRWPVLLLGNGASCAISKRFGYDSLYEVGPLTADDKELFDALGTRNFEEVLNYLRTAQLICEQVGHDANDVQKRSSSIRNALITAVNEHHVTWHEVEAEDRLLKIRHALSAYEAVFTTSYDLLLYWAVMSDGSPPGEGFGDLFWTPDHVFDPLNTEPFGGKTLVYWLHGGLHLYRNRLGETQKRIATSANLLATFASEGQIPLFVSEGTSEEKRRAIRGSDYLDHVFNTFSELKGALVVFGQALESQDEHLVQAIRRVPNRNIAFGVHASTQHHVNLQRKYFQDLFSDAAVTFYDSTTHPLGDPTLLVADEGDQMPS